MHLPHMVALGSPFFATIFIYRNYVFSNETQRHVLFDKLGSWISFYLVIYLFLSMQNISAYNLLSLQTINFNFYIYTQ